MPFKDYINVATAGLICLIAFLTAFIALQMYRFNKARLKHAVYEKRLAVYREIVALLSILTSGGDMTREALLNFRSRTHESGFLFDKELADYIEEIYTRGMKFWNTNMRLRGPKLRIGEERDQVTAENAAQMIWLADQLPLLKKKFNRYLNMQDTK